MYRFYSIPLWRLTEKGPLASDLPHDALLTVSVDPSIVNLALRQIEYRGEDTARRIERLFESEIDPVIFAKPPHDLPALLRSADQLLTMARQESGERANVWRCSCGARYAVPVSLSRPVSIRCDRCGQTIDLDPHVSQREETRTSTKQDQLNSARHMLADFFRESMARGWLVLVERSPDAIIAA